MDRFSKLFIAFLCVGLTLRIFISIWSLQFRENTDVLRWKDWGKIAFIYGLADTYKASHITFGTLANNMPPGTLYSVAGSYLLDIQISKIILKITQTKPGSLLWVNGPLLTFILRLPSLFADLVLAIFIFITIRYLKYSSKAAVIGSSLFWFNPAVIYNSSFWGQMDSINNVMFIVCIFFLFRKKFFWSILFFLFSLYVKTSLLPILPFYFLAVFYLNKKNLLHVIVNVIGAIALIYAITIPISLSPDWLWNYYMHNGFGEMTQITNFAFNFWWVIFKPHIVFINSYDLFKFSLVSLSGSPFDQQKFIGISLGIWAFVIFLVSTLPLLWAMFRQRKIHEPENIILLFSVIMLLTFLLLPRMHERYMYPVLPLLSLYVGIKKRFFILFLLLSLCNFINLYIVWHPMKLVFFPYELVSNANFQWLISIATLATSVILYAKSMRSFLSKS